MGEEQYEYGYQRLKYGKSKGCCRGFCVTGPKWGRYGIIPFNIIALYFNLVWYTYLAPVYTEKIGKALPIIAMILGVILHYTLLSAAYRDPGFLLRHSKYEELMKSPDLKKYIEE